MKEGGKTVSVAAARKWTLDRTPLYKKDRKIKENYLLEY
jgi:hypothetical protein